MPTRSGVAPRCLTGIIKLLEPDVLYRHRGLAYVKPRSLCSSSHVRIMGSWMVKQVSLI